jgi:hypothetical protein
MLSYRRPAEAPHHAQKPLHGYDQRVGVLGYMAEMGEHEIGRMAVACTAVGH